MLNLNTLRFAATTNVARQPLRFAATTDHVQFGQFPLNRLLGLETDEEIAEKAAAEAAIEVPQEQIDAMKEHLTVAEETTATHTLVAPNTPTQNP